MAGGHIICIGDKTTHGGVVVSGASTMIVNGRQVAVVGDMVACPTCKGTFPIVEGNPGHQYNGTPVAYHGCRTGCGAQLIASTVTYHHKVPHGVAPSASAPPAATTSPDMPQHTAPHTYKGRTQVIDEKSGLPLAGRHVRITCPDGKVFECTTDGEGYTPWVESTAPGQAGIEILDLKEGEYRA